MFVVFFVSHIELNSMELKWQDRRNNHIYFLFLPFLSVQKLSEFLGSAEIEIDHVPKAQSPVNNNANIKSVVSKTVQL